ARSPAFSVLARNWSFFFLILTVVVFSFTGRNFFALNNFQNIIHLGTTALLLACAETFVIITGGIDLSVGFVMGLSAVSASSTMQVLYGAHWSAPASILVGIGVGLVSALACGLAAGILVSRYKVPPFIATLGTQGIAIGITYHICGGFPVWYLPPGLTDIGNAYLLYVHPATGAWSFFSRPAGVTPTQIKELVRIFPVSFFLIIVVLVLLWHLLKNTRFGQHTYAVGGSMDASVRAGINTRRHLALIYVLSAFLAAVAGIVDLFQTGTGNFTTFGSQFELFAIAAVIIGGASLMGGKGRVVASAVGVLLLKVLENGLNLSGVEPFYRYIAVGLILIVAVVIDQLFPDLF
ncbi:MAG TPA: ABC transporter permease, partial [Spirochaetia bacterium]|nr:ABC transporter permease [Spirochaetia bacterium]